MITKDMIRSGIEEHLVNFVTDPNTDHGTVCQIGDMWFYFGGTCAEEMNPEEYISNVPTRYVVDEVFAILDSLAEEGETFDDEYAYYESILNKSEKSDAKRGFLTRAKLKEVLEEIDDVWAVLTQLAYEGNQAPQEIEDAMDKIWTFFKSKDR